VTTRTATLKVCAIALLTNLASLTIWSQPTAASGPTFEVASFKRLPPPPSPQLRNLQRGGPGTASPGQWTITNADVRFLVLLGWGLDGFQISFPKPAQSERYDIAAKVPSDTSKEVFRSMLQRLLMDRIGLVVHHESREQDVYELVVSKAGLKMKTAEAAPEGGAGRDPKPPALTFDKDGNPHLSADHPVSTVTGSQGGIMHLIGRWQSTADMVSMFEAWAGRPILDKTGLTGSYDYDVAFTADGPRSSPADGMPPPDASAAPPGVPFPAAVERQLGLTLAAKKVRWDMLVIDRFDPVPTEN
jgi:uncharacterized protein (TIGR03435 family)